MEAGACSNPEDVQPATKKAAQKLTNFRGYLHKSSVAGCFVDLLQMTDEGVMTEAGLYPSSRYKQSRNMRQSGLGTSSRSRPPTGLNGPNKNDKSQAPLQGPSNNQAEDQRKNQRQPRGHHGRRPSTALETHSAPLAAQLTRDAPLSARVGLSAGNSFAEAAGSRILSASSPSCHNNNKSEDIAGSRATILDIRRTQWVEGGSKQGVGGWLEADTAGQSQQHQGQLVGAVSATGPETNDDAEEGEKEGRNGGGHDENGGDHPGGRCNTSSTTSTSTADSPKPFSRRVAWGKAMRELSSSVTKVAHMKTAADRAMINSSHDRRARAASVRAGLIEGELLRAQAALAKNENRKRRATEAAALAASQRGLLEAISLVVATKRLWAGSLKLSQDREHLVHLGIAATVVQRAYKAYTNRRMFKVLLAIRRVHLRLYIGMNIRRKQMVRSAVVR
ncbi:hypothetical protein Esi_0024_0114 [Ectocarpus siliculosus]|uniref:Uncharacterized protein n=1 Tax=Ectocarpus siliculosus TaxID=2880 RepID=D8LJ78_ECTSI|nr:hypothetical protein Esi_0024_0114 [Ectocarpus siliculosus]|eukprot:CBN76962.1 hypothetical protein Esi_0024_0114 [Ectocarpus siliculosus]